MIALLNGYARRWKVNEYRNLIRRYKELREDFHGRKSMHNISISNKEFQSMLIQLKKSIMIRRWQYKNGTQIFKQEFPEE
jgi:hypothetical protein